MQGIRTGYKYIFISFFLSIGGGQVTAQFNFEDEIYVKEDVVELRISIIEFGNYPDTTILWFLNDNEDNTLIHKYKDLYRNEWSHYNLDSQLVTRTCIMNEDTFIIYNKVNQYESKSIIQTQRVCLASKQMKDENGRVILECYDSLCNYKIEWDYWDNGRIKFRRNTIFEHNNHCNIEEKYDSLGNKVYLSLINGSIYYEFIGEYIPGTNLPLSFYYNGFFPDTTVRDTILYQFAFDKRGNWSNRKRFVNRSLEEEVSRKIFYASDMKSFRMNNFRTKYDNNNCLINIDVVFKDYELGYDCNNNILNCLSSDGRVKWSINTKKFPEQTITRIFASNDRKYDVIIGLENKRYVKLNSKNGSFKIVKE